MHPLSLGNNLDWRGMRSWDFYGVFSAPGAARDVLKLIDLIGTTKFILFGSASWGDWVV
jgi:hypothetical protein